MFPILLPVSPRSRASTPTPRTTPIRTPTTSLLPPLGSPRSPASTPGSPRPGCSRRWTPPGWIGAAHAAGCLRVAVRGRPARRIGVLGAWFDRVGDGDDGRPVRGRGVVWGRRDCRRSARRRRAGSGSTWSVSCWCPIPEHDWLNVVAALVDALTVVVVRPPGEVTPGEASRLAARLRTRGAMLIAVGSWPGSEARLEVESNTWTGLGVGEGMLTARQATVVVTGRRAAVRRRHRLWLPGPDGTIRSVAEPIETRDHSSRLHAGRRRRWADERRRVSPARW